MNSVFSVKQLIQIIAIIALINFFGVCGQIDDVYHNEDELDEEVLEGIHPKADWKDVLSVVADTVWCEAGLQVKSLWCAGTVAFDWLKMTRLRQTDRDFCCYMYDTNQCIVTAAKQMCSKNDFDRLNRLLEAKNQRLQSGRCRAYGYRWYDWKSWKCHFPVIPFCLALITVMVTITIMYKLSPNDVRSRPRADSTGHRLGRT